MGSWELSGNKTNWQGYVLQLLNQTMSHLVSPQPFYVEAALGLCLRFKLVNCKEVEKQLF